ncbi:MAG: ABC transporter permease subunit [Myxococcota bacterium]|nr:ABC transporter permease subunit [Myxococcota bacterium]
MRAERDVRAPAIAIEAAKLDARDTRGDRLAAGRLALGAVVVLYLAIVLLGPMGALVAEVSRLGLGEVLSAVLAPPALEALGMSIALVAIAVVINAFVGTIGAIALVRHRFVGRGLLGALADLPLAVSPVMIGLAFLLLVGREGVLAPVLEALDWKIVYAFPGLVIGTSEEEAAATLGASAWQTFWRVTFPNVRVALGYGLLMTAARALGEFGAVLVLGGSISGQTQTATTFIHDAVEERALAGGYGMALVLGAISVVLLALLEHLKHRRARALGRTK